MVSTGYNPESCFCEEPLNNSLHALVFRLACSLGAILKAGWMPVEKLQQRMRASLNTPKGAI
jgi:hypothetical protein